MLAPDTVLHDRYQIVRQIGEGGMGAVYEALDLRLSSTVALKQTLVSGEQLNRQFEREAQLLARLRHPGLPKVSDYFESLGSQFLVMELIPGEDLGSLLEQNRAPFPIDTVWQWADQILEVLEYLHSQNPPIIHRDIKPQNLKRTPDGQIILLDFGLAKGSTVAQATAARSIVAFTPHYAAHEQIYAAGTDARSDLYSLGATLYALCTGVLPASAVTRISEAANNRPDPLIAPYQANRQVPHAVSSVIMRSLALSADQRYQSATAMRQAIREVSFERSVNAPSPVPSRAIRARDSEPRAVITAPPAEKPKPSRGVVVALVGVGILVLGLFVAGFAGVLASQRQAVISPPAPASVSMEASAVPDIATSITEPTVAPTSGSASPLSGSTLTPSVAAAPTVGPTSPLNPASAPAAEAPALCAAAQGADAETARSCYAPDFAAALLESGYKTNIVALQNKDVLRASQHDPIDGVWSRDLDYAASGYSYALSDMAVLRGSIELLLAGVKPDGVAPEGIFKGQRDYVYGQTWDSMPNLIHAAYIYVAKTGDRAFYERNRDTLLRMGGWIAGLDTDDDGLPDQDIFPYGYYNSVENGPLHTYALAKFYAAYTELAELEALVGRESGAWRERAARLRTGFHRPLTDGGYWEEGQPWPIAWKYGDGEVVDVLETFGVFAALRSGLIAPIDARYPDLLAALHSNLPALLDGSYPFKLTLGGYEPEVKRAIDPPLPDWKLDASAPWIVGLAAPAYAAAGLSDDARAVLEAYERGARQGEMPRLTADSDARYGPGSEGSGGTWDQAAWFMAVYGGHYGLTMTPAALMVRPRPFLDVPDDGFGSLTYQGARVQLTLDGARQVYSLQADRPIRVILRPLGSATLVRVNGGPTGAEEDLVLEPGKVYVVESSGDE